VHGRTGATGPAGNAAVATLASFRKVPSGNCLNYTETEPDGQSKCPTNTTGFSNTSPTPPGSWHWGRRVGHHDRAGRAPLACDEHPRGTD
jgi:hypothetical protein